MNALDLTPLVNPLLALAGLVVPTVAAMLVDRAIRVAKERLHFEIGEAQAEAMRQAAATAAGVAVTALARGALKIHQVTIADPTVRSLASVALSGVAAPDSATIDGMAHVIVGEVGRLVAADPTIPTLPVATPPGAKAAA